MSGTRPFAIPGTSSRRQQPQHQVWTPPERAAESDSDRERSNRQTPLNTGHGSSGHSRQRSSSRGYVTDPASRYVASPGPSSSNIYKAQPPTPRDAYPSAQPATQNARPQAQRSTTVAAVPQQSQTAYLEVPDSRARASRRSQSTPMSSSEQVSSAEESSRSSHRVQQGKSGQTSTSPYATATTSTATRAAQVANWSAYDQPSKASGSALPRDTERDERAKQVKEREERYKEDRARADRAREEQARMDYNAKKSKAEADYLARKAAERASSSRRDLPELRTQEYDSSDSSRRRPAAAASGRRQRTDHDQTVGTSHTRYATSSAQPVASGSRPSSAVQQGYSSAQRSGMQSSTMAQALHHPPSMVATQPSTSSQSTASTAAPQATSSAQRSGALPTSSYSTQPTLANSTRWDAHSTTPQTASAQRSGTGPSYSQPQTSSQSAVYNTAPQTSGSAQRSGTGQSSSTTYQQSGTTNQLPSSTPSAAYSRVKSPAPPPKTHLQPIPSTQRTDTNQTAYSRIQSPPPPPKDYLQPMTSTQHTASNQNVYNRIQSPAPPPNPNAQRSASPPPAPKIFPMYLPVGEGERNVAAREVEKDAYAREKDREREKRHREKEHGSRSHQRSSHRDRTSSTPVNQAGLSGSDNERSSRKEGKTHRSTSHSTAIRSSQTVTSGHVQTALMQDGLRADTRKDTTNNNAMLSGDASQKFEQQPQSTRNVTSNPSVSRNHPDAPPKPPDKSRSDPMTPLSPSGYVQSPQSAPFPSQVPWTTSQPHLVSIRASQGPPDRAPSRSAQKASSAMQAAESVAATAAHVRSPDPYSYDRSLRQDVLSRSQTAQPRAPSTSYSVQPNTTGPYPSRTHAHSSSQPVVFMSPPPHPPVRSETYPTALNEKYMPLSGSSSLLSPLSVAPQITPTHSSSSTTHQAETGRSSAIRVSSPSNGSPNMQANWGSLQIPGSSQYGMPQSVPVSRTPSNNSQAPEPAQSNTAASSYPQTTPNYSSAPAQNPRTTMTTSRSSPYPSEPTNPQPVSVPSYNPSSRENVPSMTPHLHSNQRYPQPSTYPAASQPSQPSYPLSSPEPVKPSLQSTSKSTLPRSPTTLDSAPTATQSFSQAMSSHTQSADKNLYPADLLSTSQMQSATPRPSSRDPPMMYQSSSYRSQQAEAGPRGYVSPASPPPGATSRSQPYATRTTPVPHPSTSTRSPAVSSPPPRPAAILSPPPGPSRSQSHPVQTSSSRSNMPPSAANVSHQMATSTRVAVSGHPAAPTPVRPRYHEGPPPLTLSSSPESYEEILMTPSSLAPTLKSPQPQVRPVSVERQEEPKKKGIFGGLFRSSSKSKQHEVWYPPTPGPSQRRESTSKPSSSKPVAALPPKAEPARLSKATKHASVPTPASGRKSPTSKGFAPFRLFSTHKRHRTVSAASLEALDGTANNTVVGSPRSSMRTATPAPAASPSPPLRDPHQATQEWRNKEERDLMDRGTHRRRRPGVTFDITPEDMPANGASYRLARASRIYASGDQ